MKSLKSVAKIALLSVLAIAPVLLGHNPASAETKGTDATYIGAGVAGGVTSGGQTNDGKTVGGVIQGRVAVPGSPLPVSLRGAVNFTDKNSAVMPMLTYDLPIAPNTNVYVGGGYQFVQHQSATAGSTPLGNKNAPVATAGVETQLGQNLVLFGDAKFGYKAYQNSSANAASVNAGAGLRF